MTEEKVFRLGSLFDGSGGFPLAGVMHGIVPVWASEIEPFAIRVTKLRFPNMKHLGSVTDVDGAKVEPVDIITFGSPCQDLSVAGKQLGIHEGQRSNLFFEAIRIIKEMRDATSDKFPRFAVWENVPGAFSSNKGEDFRAVLRAFAEIGEKRSDVSVPFPEKGKWLPAGTVVGNGWSLAWRVYDAQFWGVPQRRKRIYLIADFGSERAGEILFKPEGVPRHPEPGSEKGEGTSGDAEGSAGRSCITFKERAGCPGGGKGILIQNDKSATLATNTDQSVCYALDSTSSNPCAFMGGQGAKARSIAYCDDGSTPTIKSAPSGGNTVPDVVYPINTMVATRGGKDDMRTCFGVGEKNDPQFTLSAAHEHGVCYANGCDLYNGKLTGEIAPTLGANSCTSANHAGPSVCYAMEGNTVDRSAKQNGAGISQDISPSLNTQDRHAVAYGIDYYICLNDQGGRMMDVSDKAGCLRAQEHGHQPIVCFEPGIAKREGGNSRFVEEKSVTLRANAGDNRPAVCYGVDCRNGVIEEEKPHTIQAHNNGGFSVNCTPNVLFRNDGYGNFTEGTGTLKAHGGDAGGRSASSLSVYDARGNGNGEVCPTVCSHPKGGVHDYEPIAVQANGWQFGNISSTLCGDHENRVTDYTVLCIEKKPNVYSVENHSADSRVQIRDDDKCQTLTSRMGTGGNNVPMILEVRDE